jgi:hypothetical protein
MFQAEETVPSQPLPKTFPPPIENKEFLKAIEGNCVRYSLDGVERLCHSHGHTAQVHCSKSFSLLLSFFVSYSH